MKSNWNRLLERVGQSDSMDVGLFSSLCGLGLYGVLMVYSSTRDALSTAGLDPEFYLKRQLMFVVIGIPLMYLVSLFDYRRLEMFATPMYVGAIVALIGVYFLGSSALGAQRWYNLKIIQVQPSEFTVLILIIVFATYCQRRPQGLQMRDVYRLLLMAIVPMLLIFKQPDIGTTTILVLSVGAMMVIAGVPPRFLYLLTTLGILGVVGAVYFDVLKKYQIGRFTAFFNQNSTDASLQALIYQVANAKSAIGSGGLRGAGLFHGLQTVLGYVPEQRTDFIFTAIGEQLGFVGSLATVALLSFVAWRMYLAGRRSKDTMGRLIGIGVFIFFAFSCFENIGMTMGIMPMTGIPLPLVSYGGSAVIVFYTAGGILLSISRRSNR